MIVNQDIFFAESLVTVSKLASTISVSLLVTDKTNVF